MEHEYSLSLRKDEVKVVPVDKAVREKFQKVPSGWSLELDENLIQFLSEFSETDNENLGSIKNFVESIEVSSQSVRGGITVRHLLYF